MINKDNMTGKEDELNKDEIAGAKKQIRKHVLKTRSSMDDRLRRKYDDAIFSKILSLEEYGKTDIILTYASYNGEADTYRLIRRALADGKRVGCPVSGVRDGEPLLDFYYILSPDDLSEGYRGIPEPDVNKCMKVSKDDIAQALIIVPLVGYDDEGNRLGYGKGFYDRFLAGHEYMLSAGIAYSCQRCDKLPVDEYDVRPDIIITEI